MKTVIDDEIKSEVIKQNETDNMLDFSEQKYSTGEVATLLGIHPQSVRYFDKVGIIRPGHNNDNHRRSYSIYDVYLLTLRNNYQQLGFSVQETENIMHSADLTQISEIINERKKILQERIDLDSFLIKGINDQQKVLNQLPMLLDQCFLRMRPASWRHIHIENQGFCSNQDSCKARNLAVQLMPYSRYSFRLAKEEIDQGQSPSYRCDVSVPEDAAVFYDFHHIPGSWYAPSELCLYSILKLETLRAPQWDDLRATQNYMIENHLQINGDIYGDILISVNNETGKVRYFEIWIPVKKQDQQ